MCMYLFLVISSGTECTLAVCSESTPGALIAPTLGLLVLDELRQICWGLLSLDAIRVASCALKVLPGPLLCGA